MKTCSQWQSLVIWLSDQAWSRSGRCDFTGISCFHCLEAFLSTAAWVTILGVEKDLGTTGCHTWRKRRSHLKSCKKGIYALDHLVSLASVCYGISRLSHSDTPSPFSVLCALCSVNRGCSLCLSLKSTVRPCFYELTFQSELHLRFHSGMWTAQAKPLLQISADAKQQ